MFTWLRRIASGSPGTASPGRPPARQVPDIAFKSDDDFMEYACKYLAIPKPAVNVTMLAQVQGASRMENGSQVVFLEVADRTKRWETAAQTCGRRGPDLKPGEMVLWRIILDNPEPATPLTRWVGVVFTSVHPTITPDGQWRIKNDYPFDEK